jgi:hypothetical protein
MIHGVTAAAARATSSESSVESSSTMIQASGGQVWLSRAVFSRLRFSASFRAGVTAA